MINMFLQFMELKIGQMWSLQVIYYRIPIEAGLLPTVNQASYSFI